MYSIIPCAEKHGSVQEDFSILEAPTASVTLQVEYANRYDLIADLLLNRRPWPFYVAEFVPLATTATIVPIPAQYLPDFSGQVILYTGLVDVTVGYTSKFQDLFSDEIESTANFQTLNANNFVWNDGLNTPLLEGQEPGFLRRGHILARTFYDVLDPLNPAIFDYENCVNEDQVISTMGFVYEPETLLYLPPSGLTRTVRFDSTNAWQVPVKFQYKPPPGWNYFFNDQKQQYMQVRTKQSTWNNVSVPSQIYKPFTPVPFNGIFFI